MSDAVHSQMITDAQEIDLVQELGLDTETATEAPKEEPAAETPAPTEPKEATDPPKEEAEPTKEENKTEQEEQTPPLEDTKADVVKDLLSEMLEANTPKKAPEPMTDAEKSELAEVKARLETLEAEKAEKEEAEAIVSLLNEMPKEESELLKPEVLKLIKSDIYLKLTKAEFTPQEKASTFLAMASKLKADALSEIQSEKLQQKAEAEKKAKEVASMSSNTGNVSASEQRKKELEKRANDGDVDAIGEMLLDEFDLEKGIQNID